MTRYSPIASSFCATGHRSAVSRDATTRRSLPKPGMTYAEAVQNGKSMTTQQLHEHRIEQLEKRQEALETELADMRRFIRAMVMKLYIGLLVAIITSGAIGALL